MYFLYLDDAGSPANANEDFFVLAGLCVFERQIHWIQKDVESIFSSAFPGESENLELHSSRIRSGDKRWRGVPKETRSKLLDDSAKVIGRADLSKVRLFGAAIHKRKIAGQDPVIVAYEQVISRFDQFLGRLHKSGDTHRGLIIFDKSTYESDLQRVTVRYRESGHQWGSLRNIAEVPVFMDSRASRMVQLADLVAFATYRYFEKGDNALFTLLEPHFDREGGVRHGLFFNSGPKPNT